MPLLRLTARRQWKLKVITVSWLYTQNKDIGLTTHGLSWHDNSYSFVINMVKQYRIFRYWPDTSMITLNHFEDFSLQNLKMLIKGLSFISTYFFLLFSNLLNNILFTFSLVTSNMHSRSSSFIHVYIRSNFLCPEL